MHSRYVSSNIVLHFPLQKAINITLDSKCRLFQNLHGALGKCLTRCLKHTLQCLLGPLCSLCTRPELGCISNECQTLFTSTQFVGTSSKTYIPNQLTATMCNNCNRKVKGPDCRPAMSSVINTSLRLPGYNCFADRSYFPWLGKFRW